MKHAIKHIHFVGVGGPSEAPRLRSERRRSEGRPVRGAVGGGQ
jgi:hypothetical protein